MSGRGILAVLALAGCTDALAQSPDTDATPAQSQSDTAAPMHAGHMAQHADARHAADTDAVDSAPPPAGHLAPSAPAQTMGPMSAAQMVDVMGMDDRAIQSLIAFDRLEYAKADDGHALSWSAQGWLGGDFDKLHMRTEGTSVDGSAEQADLELLWSHAIAPFWNSQLGMRSDFGRGPARQWAAFGLQGLAPYWFEIAATAYVGDQNRTALRFEADYELLLTQRLVLQPRLEINAYGKADPADRIGAGVSDAQLGLRLRYEIRREFAPYVGVEQTHSFGRTADFTRMDGRDATDLQWVAGVRIWF
jgi:copper resistance protein B